MQQSDYLCFNEEVIPVYALLAFCGNGPNYASELWCFISGTPEKRVKQTVEAPMIAYNMTLI